MGDRKVNLRAIEIKDIDYIYEWENDREVWHLSNTLVPFSRYVLEQYILSSHQDIYVNKQLRLMIDVKESSGFIMTVGSIDLFDFEPQHYRAGIGILIAKEYRRKGYGSDALEELIKYCFVKLNLHQLYCNITSDNQESINLFQKKGFEIAGLKREWLFVDGRWLDEYILQLIKH